MKKQTSRRNWKRIALVIVFAVAAGGFLYINDFYRALPEALDVIASPSENITIIEEENDQVIFAPENAKA
ncbi:MAG: hypothetical protein IJ274_11265 [Lachnospiraceae bacterium]|nr:hypothetical protein [Lachnospiraceae bacterium]